MTPLEKTWLQNARRDIRYALDHAKHGNWEAVIHSVGAAGNIPAPAGSVILEVSNLLASIRVSRPSDFRGSAAMRGAAIRRLEEAKILIGSSLVGG